MDPHRRVAMRSPNLSTSPDRSQASSRQSQHSVSGESDTSSNYAAPTLNVHKRPAYAGQPLPSFVSHKNASTTSINHVRPSAQYVPGDATRKLSTLGPGTDYQRHRPRQHSQGYFEPSMPSASLASQSNLHPNMSGLTPSQIAAQAAMQHLNVGTNHIRRKSSTVYPEQEEKNRRDSRGSASSNDPSPTYTPEQPVYRNGLVGNTAAATAATAVWRPPTEEKEKKGLRRFRPIHIGIIRDRDKEAKEKPMPSPNKVPTSGLAKVYNASTTSLAETLSSTNSSMYNLQNPSATTIIPIKDDKEKPYKHHGLRQKLKLKDKEDHNLPLSSANSNSKPVDINNPQSLYSFAPSSPGPTSTFAKSVSGLDLRHGGRALREKKKEEKAHAQLEPVHSRESDTSEWPSLYNINSNITNASTAAFTPYSTELSQTLASFGLNNMTPDDAWEFLKAKLLGVFEGEDVRIAVEDLNRLVTIHVQKCVLRKDPSIIVGDLDDLLRTGFLSLNHTLRGISEEKLVPHLVSMWMSVFGTVLPFIQAVFLPLDQEFKGRGSVLKSPQAAAEFWGFLPGAETGSRLSSSSAAGEGSSAEVAAGAELDVRRILLICFRDTVILPRFDLLKATFSRLSMDSINATLVHFDSNGRSRGDSLGSDRPGTAASLDPTMSSYSSQTSTLLGTNSSGARSRAASNLSSGSAQDVAFQSFSSPPAARPGDNSSAQITEKVGRMLQCLSVLCSIQSGDEPQTKMEDLNKHLKLNWLGRGRTGRNRKGFVGSRVRPMRSVGSTIRDARDGSPTPTPTRQGTVTRQGGDDIRERVPGAWE